MSLKFNPKNKPKDSEVKCCLQTGVTPKDKISIISCYICNLICTRKLFKVKSFCSLFRVEKSCNMCKERRKQTNE